MAAQQVAAQKKSKAEALQFKRVRSVSVVTAAAEYRA
jgi:hypothetical protein